MSSDTNQDACTRQQLWCDIVRCYASEADAEKTAKPWLDDLFPIWKALQDGAGAGSLHTLDNQAYRIESILVLLAFLAHRVLKKRVFFVSATHYYMQQANAIFNTFKARWNANAKEQEQNPSSDGIDMYFGSPEIFPSVQEKSPPFDLVCMHGSNWFPGLFSPKKNNSSPLFQGVAVVQDMKGEADSLSFQTPCMYGYND